MLAIAVMSLLSRVLKGPVKDRMLTPKEKMLQIIKEELFYREFYSDPPMKEAPNRKKKPEDTKNEDIKKST